VPFAWQVLERIPEPDLNHWWKRGELVVDKVAFQMGAAIARWQTISCEGFGTLGDPLRGAKASYADYFHLRLEAHLDFLCRGRFMETAKGRNMRAVVADHAALLQQAEGCLVHKDVALWNLLGTADRITAFIDFDDAVSGDAVDDLSLLACFHDAAFLRRTLEGYQSVTVLPRDLWPRFWLHLLRNMIVKAVIRLGAGYFDRDDGFFLIGRGASGSDLRAMTQARLDTALHALCEGGGLERLD
jgi:fructosamine-3-kinase